MSKQDDNYLALIVNDIEQFIDQEQNEKDIDRKTAVSNVMFEWQAYWSRKERPEYVDKYRDAIAQQIFKEKVNDDMAIDGFRKPAGNGAYQVTVRGKELKEAMDEEIKKELGKRGEPV